jgi:hypothetical protein
MDEPTPTDYAFLILLKIEARQVSNSELKKRHGVTLIGADCARLVGMDLVDSITDRRPYLHTITTKGAKLLDETLTVAEVDAKDSRPKTREKQLWAALAALHEHHRTAPAARPSADGVPETPSAAVANGGLPERIRAAYVQLATEPGAWVSLRRLRPLFSDVSKADLDRALRSLVEDADVTLEPEANQKTLTVEDRRASVRIGGEDRHLLAIGLR